MYRLILLVILFFTYSNSYSQCSPEEIVNLRKTAIVFGERDYKTGPLKNTINDAIDITDSLRKLDFYVEMDTNNTLESMSQALEKWYSKLKDYDVALFYFSGHGSQVSDVNYLFPIDADPKSLRQLYAQTYPANEVVEKLSDSSLRCGIIILDACRSNPFAKSWNRDAVETGLKSMAGRGTFIGFAASPGQTASDGKEINGVYQRNGIYTQAILRYITQKDLSLNQIFTKVNNEVRLLTGGDQITFSSTSMNSDFCFNVSFTKRDSIKRSNPAFHQSSSTMAFSPSQDKLYIIDNISNKLMVKNLNSTNNTLSFSDSIKPYGLATSQHYVYVLDSAQKTIFIIDPEQDKVKSKFKFLNTPISFSISAKEKKAYILQALVNNQTELLSFDLQTFDTSQLFKFNWKGNSVITSSDDSKILISASKNDSSVLFKLDTKSLRVTDSVKINSLLQAMAFSSTGRELYVKSKKASESRSQLLSLGVAPLTIKDTVNVDANTIEVCNDSNYLVVCNNSGLNIIRLKDKTITNTINISSSPLSTATSNNYVSYIWLPQEKRTLVKDMKGNLQPIHVLTPDEKLKAFIADQSPKFAADKQLTNRLTYKTMLNVLENAVLSSVYSIREKIGPEHYEKFSGPNPIHNFDTGKATVTYSDGIISNLNKKYLVFLFSAKVEDDYLLFQITLDNAKVYEHNYPLSLFQDGASWSQVKEDMIVVITDLFKSNLDRLQ